MTSTSTPAAASPTGPESAAPTGPSAPVAAPATLGSPGGENWLLLDRQICFSLHAAARAFNGLYRVILKDLGLTYPQYLVMLVLWEQPGGEGADEGDGRSAGDTGEGVPVKRLGERLRLDSGTLSPLLKRLEAAGLVRRERSARDERSVRITLTEEGRALRERALRVPRRIAAATGSSPEEIDALRARLDQLTDVLDAAAREEEQAGSR
ncbi:MULTISPECIES: MarR family winged helix-turn-helix transcriptional regulator [unclassified Streptomyces]|uniref:MarR family winged helix-turn-helix transcriptional regulator n=1 Tax=unclassified Streptomyces TaxID=2593676 RepID=UPI0037F7C9C0